MVLRYLSVVIIILLLDGCIFNNLNKKKVLIQATSQSLNSYIGRGKGKSRQEARYIALNDIASQISLTIDSSTVLNKRATFSTYSRDIQNMIRVEVPKVSFQNYNILDEKKINENYFVTLEIDKKLFVARELKRLQRKLDELSQQLESYSSKLKKYSILKKVKVQKLFLSLELIHAIDSETNIALYEKKIEELNREKNAYIRQLSFQIKSVNSRVVKIVSSILNRENLIVSSLGKIRLSINLNKIEKNQLDKQYIGTTEASIEIDENYQRIYSKTVRLSGTSFISEHYVIEEIFNQLDKKLNIIFKEIL